MNKNNINLVTVSEIDKCGISIALRKGVNEIICASKKKKKKAIDREENKNIKASVIICTIGASKIFDKSVISALTQREKAEILVVLNGDKEISVPEGVKLIKEEKKGLSNARNRGACEAEGDILVYIDDDAVADENMVGNIINAFKENPSAGVIGGQIFLEIPPEARDIVAKGREGIWSQYRVGYKKYKKIREQYEFPYGACFAVRKDALKEAGGFDVNYGRTGDNYEGGEETALCWKLIKSGWEIGVEPNAFVIHRVDKERFNYEHIRETIRAGIKTSYRLCNEGYAEWKWDKRYIKERIKIAELEIKKFEKKSAPLEKFYKICEKEAFEEILLIEENDV